jgi:uncharacterized Zn-binding protein involved in type VI secretion
MPAVARQGDSFSTGHGCAGQSTLTNPSTDVFVNDRGVERRGDPSVPHTIRAGKKCIPHTVVVTGGSGTVFVNDKPIARRGDSIDAGQITGGSPDVFAG